MPSLKLLNLPGQHSEAAGRSASELLLTQNLGCFAISDGLRVNCWTAYFAWDRSLTLVLLTSMQSRHGRVLKHGAIVRGCIWKPVIDWGEPIAGLQLAGRVTRQDSEALERVYANRFPAFALWKASGGSTSSSFIALHLEWLKVIDELNLGEEVFIEMGADRGE